MVQRAAEYRWSSAPAHLTGEDKSGILDMEWWRREGLGSWDEVLKDEEVEAEARLRGCTYAGRPFGEESFVSEIAQKFGRYWTRGRPKKEAGPKQAEGDRELENSSRQFPLF